VGVNHGGRPRASMNTVVPTHVGVNRHHDDLSRADQCRPHTRGGEPLIYTGIFDAVESSPHTWG